MKVLFTTYLIFIFFNTFSQNNDRVLIIKDAITQLPIAEATVLILKTKQVLITNADGKVRLNVKGISNIKISHTAYIEVQIRSNSIKANEKTILLSKNIKQLDELVFTNEHPQKILLGIIKNSIKKLTVPARLKVYSREFFKLNGNYAYYNDGLINFQLVGNSKKFTSNILVEQNRSYGLIDAEISSDLLGYNLNNLIENYYTFKYLTPLLTPISKKKYDFIIKIYSKDNSYYVLNAIPLDNTTGLLDDFEIIYDPKMKIIIETKSNLSYKSTASVNYKTAVGAKNIYKSMYKNIFRFEDNVYYLVSAKEELGYEQNINKGTKKIEVINSLVTTNFNLNNFTYRENELFKNKSLFNKNNVIITDYWNDSGLIATEAEQQIIDSLRYK